MNIGKLIKLSAIAAAFFSVASAAQQGTLGPTSTGSVNISLTIPALVQISGLTDIALGTVNGPFPATGSTPACIYSNNSGNYTVTVTGSGTGGAFTVSGPSPATTSTIAYTATWTAGSGAAQSLTAGTKLSGLSGANTTSTNCGGSTNATFAISFSSANIAAAPAGGYSGTATILISPT